MRSSSMLRPGLVLCTVALAAVTSWSACLRNGFVWDDFELVVQADRPSSPWQVLTHDYFARGGLRESYGYFRPLSSASLLADRAVWRLEPLGFHLTNLLLHIVCSLLATALLLALGLAPGAALLGGVLFAVHPLHAENVAWISGRTDLVAFAFGVGAMLLEIRAQRLGPGLRRASVRIAALLTLTLALLGKEMAVVVVPWLLLVALASGARSPRQLLARVGPPAAVVAGYLVVRFGVLGVAPPWSTIRPEPLSVALTVPITVVRYLVMLAAPAAPSAYLVNPYVTSLTEPRWILALAAIALIGGIAWRHRARAPRAVLLTTMLATSFVPILNLVRLAGPPGMGAVMAERFAYWPSLPFCGLIALGCWTLAGALAAHPWARTTVTAAVLGLVATAAVASWNRCHLWRDERTFLEWATATSPQAVPLWYRLALDRMAAGDLAGAHSAILRGEQVAPDDALIVSARVVWLVRSGRAEEAAALQQKLVAALGEDVPTREIGNLAWVYREAGRTKEARQLLTRLISEGHGSFETWANLAQVEMAEGRSAEAAAACRTAMSLRPNDGPTARACAGIAVAASLPDDAVRFLNGALADSPGNSALETALAVVEITAGQWPAARHRLEEVIARSPGYAPARIVLARGLSDHGDVQDARREFLAVLRGASDPAARRLARQALSRLDAHPGSPLSQIGPAPSGPSRPLP